MALTRILLFNTLKRNITPLASSSYQFRNISTSKKNRETATVINPAEVRQAECKTKNWISYGFSQKSEEDDQHYLHMTMFVSISVVLVGCGFLLAYRPDDLSRDWAQREGFLELRRREKLGLPLVDRDYIPIDQLNIPSDEELGDTEIII